MIETKPLLNPGPATMLAAPEGAVRQAVEECRREIAEAAAALDKFRADWFRENPPRPGEAHEDASGVELAAVQLQRAARSLIQLTNHSTK